MPIDRSDILAALARLQLPDGGDLVSRDFIRAVGGGWGGGALCH
jgi:ATP-binding protein involved in chromosome partitioning